MNIFTGKTPPAPPYWEDRCRVITAWEKLKDSATQIHLSSIGTINLDFDWQPIPLSKGL